MYRNLVNRLSLFRLNFLEILSYSMINSKSLANKVGFPLCLWATSFSNAVMTENAIDLD